LSLGTRRKGWRGRDQYSQSKKKARSFVPNNLVIPDVKTTEKVWAKKGMSQEAIEPNEERIKPPYRGVASGIETEWRKTVTGRERAQDYQRGV